MALRQKREVMRLFENVNVDWIDVREGMPPYQDDVWTIYLANGDKIILNVCKVEIETKGGEQVG